MKKKPNTYPLDDPSVKLSLKEKEWVEQKDIPENIVEHSERRKTIIKLIDRLPDRQRHMVYLYYFSDKTTKEIAEIQAVQEGTVYATLYQSKKKLKQYIENTYGNYVNLGAMVPMILLFKEDYREAIALGFFTGGTTVATGIFSGLGKLKYTKHIAIATGALATAAMVTVAGFTLFSGGSDSKTTPPVFAEDQVVQETMIAQSKNEPMSQDNSNQNQNQPKSINTSVSKNLEPQNTNVIPPRNSQTPNNPEPLNPIKPIEPIDPVDPVDPIDPKDKDHHCVEPNFCLRDIFSEEDEAGFLSLDNRLLTSEEESQLQGYITKYDFSYKGSLTNYTKDREYVWYMIKKDWFVMNIITRQEGIKKGQIEMKYSLSLIGNNTIELATLDAWFDKE